jgi:hypothetical protein
VSASTSAWVRERDTTYGAGKFPFGPCADCDQAACHRSQDAAGNERLVCRDHLPEEVVFCPFLGQQEKLVIETARRVLGGGGAGGSKTYAGSRLWLKQYQGEQPRYERGEIRQSLGHFLFLRRTIPELLQVIDDFHGYRDIIGPNRWDGDHNCCTFENGYKVQFGGIKDDNDWRKYYGAAYTMIVFDEATHFTKTQIQQLDSRIRCADKVLGKQLQLYLLTNPVGGETKQWLKEQFVTHGPEKRVFASYTLADGRTIRQSQVYIPCNLYDNPALVADGQYEASLMGKGDATRRALLLNDWDVDEGTWVGDDWDRDVHVCEPFPIPKSWPRTKAGDYGYGRSTQTRTRTAIHWYASDPEGNLVCYRAWSCRGLTAYEVGVRIREIERQPLTWKDKSGRRITITEGEWDEERECSNVYGPMDASMWSAQGEAQHGESRGEILDALGCGFYRSDKGHDLRKQSAEHIRNRLRSRTPDAKGSLDPGIPGLRFFRGLTETRMPGPDGGTILTGPTHTIPGVQFDPKDPDVWDTDGDDHDLDTLAYEVLDRPIPGEKTEEREDDNVVDLWKVREPVKSGGIQW